MSIEHTDIKTARCKLTGFIMLQLNGTTLQGLWRKSYGYKSDTFNRQYKTILDAKVHTAYLVNMQYFGECFTEEA